MSRRKSRLNARRIEHNKLEFTLTLKIRRDPHIAAQFKALAPPVPPPQPAPAPKPKGGMFSFLSSSPKKASRATPPPPAVPAKLPDNLARYMKQDCTLARALISFKDVAARCDTRLFEISYPLIGQRTEASGGVTTMELGEIVLQMFRLPTLPGVLSHHLPQSLDECLRGLRHVAWHKVTYFEGTLTQNGGDCTVGISYYEERTELYYNFIDVAATETQGHRGKSHCIQRCHQKGYGHHQPQESDCSGGHTNGPTSCIGGRREL